MFRNLFIAVFLIFHSNINGQNKYEISTLDSVYVLRDLAINSDLKLEERLNYAHKAVNLSRIVDIDSTILKSNQILSFMYLSLDKYELFKKINYENLSLSIKLKDSSTIGNSYNNLGYYHYQKTENDSAYYYYYKAEIYYRYIKLVRSQVEMLFNMANIQEEQKDYVGAEGNATKAIASLLTLKQTNDNTNKLWSLYNLLGIISTRLKLYDQAIEYHKKALSIIESSSKKSFRNITSQNNIAAIYTEQSDYIRSLAIYDKLIKEDNLKLNDPSAYSMIKGNIAYTRFLKKDEDLDLIKKEFKEAYRISDSIEDLIGLMIISHDMSEFYLTLNKKDSALILSKKAYKLARESDSNDIILKSLLTLSRIQGSDLGINYLNEYIKLNASLIQKERSFHDKIARVKFNTDQLKAENKQISKERLIFLFISIGLLATLTSLYIIIKQRNRNRKLKFVQAQQKANEEIYNLMLAQQDKVEEGRAVEKKRVSQELHDGILGRLFGTRLNLDSLNMVNTDEAIKTREQYINELQSIEQEIRKISHDLNSNFITGSSFRDIVSALIENQTKAYKLSYTFTDDKLIKWESVSNKNKINIYRILQETMQNIYKHAQANHINIGFQLKKDVILMSIEDDGKGFNTEKVKKGIGIKNINDRVKDFGGKVKIDSVINEGTHIKITLPFN